MKRLISAQLAGSLLQTTLLLLLIFHILILVGVVPPNIVWGGQIGDSPHELVLMEIIALTITLLFILVVRLRLSDLRMHGHRPISRIGVWIVAVYFALNTVGNLASGVAAENFIFAPITVLMALLAIRLGFEE